MAFQASAAVTDDVNTRKKKLRARAQINNSAYLNWYVTLFIEIIKFVM